MDPHDDRSGREEQKRKWVRREVKEWRERRQEKEGNIPDSLATRSLQARLSIIISPDHVVIGTSVVDPAGFTEAIAVAVSGAKNLNWEAESG